MKAMIKNVSKLLGKLAGNEEGASAVEYAILAAVIGAGLVTASGTLSSGIQTAFTNIKTTLTSSTPAG